tara:strand:- start:1205 stop:2293 length:1089 start_codon:yes stop_codon:yes gene_type:complete
MKIVLCKICVLTNTRPNVKFDINGICSVCNSFQQKEKKINWKLQKKKFKILVKQIKKQSSGYDVLIPVSGGKDSTWQVYTCLKHNLNPLTFSYKPILRTTIGQENLNNLMRLGVDHIDFTINRKVELHLLKKSFFKFGAVGLPMHMAMWAIASQMAKKYNIKYIVWGENPATEYSGTKESNKLNYLDEKWIKKFGINFNTKINDWFDNKLTSKNTIPFQRNNNNQKSIFLGQYIKWDPKKIYKIAKYLGFKESNKPKTGVYKFADIDDDLISIHHYLKLYKFGFTRAFDNLSLEIRNNRISRNIAIKEIKNDLKKKPIEDIRKFCKLINISERKFFQICEKFRNKKIWMKKNRRWNLNISLK